ncbi:FAD-binding oxidoreductase [Cohaesibacter sp. CAU 1516]|uniref:NAD(P)/FAD-dependent oxidoreductase n=1 Tax=Cohaesibacter sp. CAU 1516 TaxID=2576038 RepID=UPI0010FD8522|nr:FAD-binding oxidoreductase [Cohaesibacter sp. CAU 1516]TLP48501.1 FAD-binding oxidoreductase [Cohaesibacter sp. CAU 1516]
MTMDQYIDSYYRDTKVDAAFHAPIEGEQEADVCVIGGGLAGLTAARELAKAGKSVILLEGQRIGWGASGRNGGFVSNGYAEGMQALEDKLGLDHAKALFDLSVMGTDYVRNTIAALQPPGVEPKKGWLRVLRYSNEDQLRRSADHMKEKYGARFGVWTTEQVRDSLVTKRYFQGLNDPTAFHIQPLNYALALAADLVATGGRLYEASPARALDRSGAGWMVTCETGARVKAGAVLLCGSAYMQDLYPKLERAVLPVATYVITSEAMPERLAEAIRYAGCIGDTRRAGDYYRLVEDGARLLWGGRITTRRSEPKALADMLKKDILAIYPQLGDFKIEHAWAGLMGYCVHKMPILREMEPGLWAATGTGGHGLNATATIGVVAAEGIAGTSDRHRLFKPFTAQWGGGSIGRIATQMVYWGLQLQDMWEERRG